MTWAIVAAAVVGAGASVYSSSQAADAVQGGAEAQAAAARNAADDANVAAMRAIEEISYGSSKAATELRKQYNISVGLFEADRLLGGQATASQLAMLAASPIPSMREAAQKMIDSMGGVIKTQKQQEVQRTPQPVPDFIDPVPMHGGYDPWKAKYGLPQSASIEEGQALYRQLTEERQNIIDMQPSGPQYEMVTEETPIPTIAPIDFETSPGYEFRLGEGQKSIEKSAAARGSQLSGQTMKALSEYSQNVASNEYDKFLNQYYQSLSPFTNLATIGQNATSQVANLGMATAQGLGNIYTGASANIANSYLQGAGLQGGYTTQGGDAAMTGAQAQAGGYINTANSLNNALAQMAMGYGMTRGSSYPTPTPQPTSSPGTAQGLGGGFEFNDPYSARF